MSSSENFGSITRLRVAFYIGVSVQGVTDYGSGRMADEKPKSLIKINL
jgi:hypothetical protein